MGARVPYMPVNVGDIAFTAETCALVYAAYNLRCLSEAPYFPASAEVGLKSCIQDKFAKRLIFTSSDIVVVVVVVVFIYMPIMVGEGSLGSNKTALSPGQVNFTEGGIWQRRSKLEKFLVVLLVLFFIATIVFLILFVVYYIDATNEVDGEVDEHERCTTLDCLETASFVSQSINDSVHPCDDFYHFACGRWLKRHPLTPSKAQVNVFGLVDEELTPLVRDLLDEKDPNAIDAFKKTRSFYRSCVDTDAMDAKGTAPMLDLLKTAGSNFFPTLEPSWKDENMTLNQILARMGGVGGMGLTAFVSMKVKTDEKHSDQNVIYFSQQGLVLLARHEFLAPRNSSTLMMYQQLYEDLTVILGADNNTARQDASDVVDFEIKLANATIPPKLLGDRNKMYTNMTVQELSQRYQQFDWLEYLQRTFQPVGINITRDEQVVLDAVPYYDALFQVIHSAPRRVVLNYCMWTIVRLFSSMLDKRSRQTHDVFARVKNGATRTEDRWKHCVGQVRSVLKDSVGRMYVQHHFPHDARSQVITMIGDLKDAFKEMIQEADWMTDQTKTAALDKLTAVVDKVAYPLRDMNDTYLNEQYKNVSVKEDEFFQNSVQSRRHNRDKLLRKLRKPVDREEWPLSAAIVNAFYHPVTNSIFFPAGILQKPFYDKTFLDAMNYGAIGFVIGHELTHGFDITGRSFDKIGNLRMWWQPQDLQRFQDRTMCLVDQYSSFVDPVVKQHVDGNLTIGENIADNGGMKEAYRAYRKMIAKRGKEEDMLPVLNYTPDQLFFISSAQVWCRNISPQLRPLYLKSSVHSPNQFRVIGPMQNNADFSRAFNCEKGRYMNPEKKCQVW